MKIVLVEVGLKLIYGNPFDYLAEKGQVRYGSVVCQDIDIQGGFLQEWNNASVFQF